MIKYTLFHLNNVGKQMQQNLISSFFDDTSFTTATHLRFQCECKKNHFDVILLFSILKKRMVTSGDNEYLLKILVLCH